MPDRREMLAKLRRFAIVSVPCDACGAGVGSCCYGPNGGVSAFCDERLEAALAAMYATPDPRDNRGKLVEPGAKVAFNLSGQLAAGEIVSVRATPNVHAWGASHKWTIRVRLTHQASGFWPGHVSKVTDPRNVLVLEAL